MNNLNEFSIIEDFFITPTAGKRGVIVGSGDDAAVLELPANQQLCVSMDTSIAGIHFPLDLPAEAIGFRALSVALSDLAAMSATPLWSIVSLSAPKAEQIWFKEFAKGIFTAAKTFGDVQIVGGDLTKGSLSITAEVTGYVPKGKAVLRSGAKVGDSIYVSNNIGDAALGLKLYQASTTWREKSSAEQNYIRPTPQIKLGIALQEIANSMIDISDGLLQDLSHILKASNVGAIVNIEDIPCSAQLSKLPEQQRIDYILHGGDDYQLLFTVPAEKENLLAEIKVSDISKIGNITETDNLEVFNNGKKTQVNKQGFRHF